MGRGKGRNSNEKNDFRCNYIGDTFGFRGLRKQFADTTSSGASDATEIKVGTGNEALPYAYLDENGEYDGYDVAVVKAIDEKLLDYTFTFEGADFPTTLSNLESNKVQMAAYEYEVNDERKEKFVYGDVGYVVWDTYIVSDPDAGTVYDSFEDLAGKKSM